MYWLFMLGALFALNSYYNPKLLCALPIGGAMIGYIQAAMCFHAGRVLLAAVCLAAAFCLTVVSLALARRLSLI